MHGKYPSGPLRPEQFAALAEGMHKGPAQEMARLVLVDGLAPEDARAQLGISRQAAHQALARAHAGLDRARRIVGGPGISTG